MAVKLIILLLVLVTAMSVTGCEQQIGPNDKTVNGKEYKDLVNQGVPEDEKQSPKKN